MNSEKIVFNRILIFIEIMSYFVLLISFIFAIVAMANGKQIPKHVDFNGNVDGYTDAGVLIMMPIIMLIIIAPDSLLLHFLPTSFFNMPFKVNPERRVVVFQWMAYMIELMSLISATFALVFNTSMSYFDGKYTGLVSIVYLILLTVDIIWCSVMGWRRNKV